MEYAIFSCVVHRILDTGWVLCSFVYPLCRDSLRAFRHSVIRGLVAKVSLVQLRVMAAVGQQLAVAAVLNDFTVRHHNDAVR